jgi:LysR family transcriptional regulator for bpeEF and oprC
MENLHGILVFLNVVDAGTLSGAARKLGVSTAAVSATLARLEKKLAVRLLDRTTRRLAMTPEGTEFYARCKQIVSDLDDAERAVSQTGKEPSGLLRVGMPQGLGRMWIIPQLPRFLRQYPAISLEVVCRDVSAQTRDTELDISVRSGELQSSRLAARQLASCRYVVCGAQDYFDANGIPKTIEALDQHACLAYRRPRNGRIRQWKFGAPTGDFIKTIRGLTTFNSNEALVAAAIAGLGIIQVAEYYVRPALTSGELIEILAPHKTGGYEISAVFPQQQHLAPKHRVFIDFLVSIFSEAPWIKSTVV